MCKHTYRPRLLILHSTVSLSNKKSLLKTFDDFPSPPQSKVVATPMRSTRSKSKNKLYLLKFSTSRCQKSFKYHSAKIWDPIPSKLIKKKSPRKLSPNAYIHLIDGPKIQHVVYICKIFFSFYFQIIYRNGKF